MHNKILRDIPGSNSSSQGVQRGSARGMESMLSQEHVLGVARQLFPNRSYTSDSVSLKRGYVLLQGDPNAMLFFSESGSDYRACAGVARALLNDIGISVGQLFEAEGAIGFSYTLPSGGSS